MRKKNSARQPVPTIPNLIMLVFVYFSSITPTARAFIDRSHHKIDRFVSRQYIGKIQPMYTGVDDVPSAAFDFDQANVADLARMNTVHYLSNTAAVYVFMSLGPYLWFKFRTMARHLNHRYTLESSLYTTTAGTCAFAINALKAGTSSLKTVSSFASSRSTAPQCSA